MNEATFVRQLDGFMGDARLYKMEPPIKYEDYEDERYVEKTANYVVVSAANAMFSGPETYIFPADESGEVIDWGELDGSFRGGWNHEAALAGAGYSIKEGAAA